MAKAKKSAPAEIIIRQRPGEPDGLAMARTLLGPELRHGQVAGAFGVDWLNTGGEKPGLMDCADYLASQGEKAVAGDLAMASRLLMAQALTLDAMFTELARRAAMNMGAYLDAADRYARLALKAQSNSRATLEALAKLHQPREQTVRHVHVNEGGQAIVADQFHHHAGRPENAESAEQSHATGTAGQRAALPRPDASGDALPIANGEGAEAVPDARRD